MEGYPNKDLILAFSSAAEIFSLQASIVLSVSHRQSISLLSHLAGAIGPTHLIQTIDELADGLGAIRRGDEARLALEVALIKAARPDLDPGVGGLAKRVERLETGMPSSGGAGETGPAPPEAVVPASAEEPPMPAGSEAEDDSAGSEAPGPEPEPEAA